MRATPGGGLSQEPLSARCDVTQDVNTSFPISSA